MSGMSGSIGAVAFESELNAVVKEYLEFSNYSRSLSTFEQECKEQSKPIGPTEKPQSDKRLLSLQHDMLKMFHYGDRDGFLRLWRENISRDQAASDDVGSKLEFYMHIYFATHPVRLGKEQREVEVAMQAFKRYIESSGSALSQTTEFLPFYALPFVPNAREHPSYKEIFTEMWVSDLQVRLERYLTLALKASKQPRLFDLYRGTGGRAKEVQDEIDGLRDKAGESERKAMAYLRRYNKQQADYHGLISITADLVDTLEATIRGKMVRPEYLQQVCQRLFANQTGQSVDLTRPGTAGQMLRQSVAQPSSSHGRSRPSSRHQKKDNSPYPSLDCDKIRQDLTGAEDRTRALLLQALRWRLTKATAGRQREDIMRSYVHNDLLGCTQPGPYREGVLGLLASESEVVREYLARLFNAFASLCSGRSYLSKNDDLLRALVETLRMEQKDSLTRENVLGTLQKLSLRRQLQSAMIEEGLIMWLVQSLEDHDSLSDYTLEYSVALLMNLCLRTAGKRKCAENPRLVLKVLSDLLGHENLEIRPYVNGALYSILGIPSIREEANAMDMESILRCFIKEDQPDMTRQIEFILSQLTSSDTADAAESDDDEEEEDEEDQEAMEADIDKAEVLKASSGELAGERLLTQDYLGILTGPPPPSTPGRRRTGSRVDILSEEVLMRPTTPGHLKHTQDHPPSSQDHPPSSRSQPGSRPGSRSKTNGAVAAGERPRTRAGSRPGTGESGG